LKNNYQAHYNKNQADYIFAGLIKNRHLIVIYKRCEERTE